MNVSDIYRHIEENIVTIKSVFSEKMDDPSTSQMMLRPNKKISVFRVTGLKILGRVGTHFFTWKKIQFSAF